MKISCSFITTNLLENTAKRALVSHFELNCSANIYEYRKLIGSEIITEHQMTTRTTNLRHQSVPSSNVSQCSWVLGILDQQARQSAGGADRWLPFRIHSVTGRGVGGFKVLIFGGSENPLFGHGFEYLSLNSLSSTSSSSSLSLPTSSSSSSSSSSSLLLSTSSSSSSSTSNHTLEVYRPLKSIQELKKDYHNLFKKKGKKKGRNKP